MGTFQDLIVTLPEDSNERVLPLSVCVNGYLKTIRFIALSDRVSVYPLLFTLVDIRNPEEHLLKPELL